MYIKCTETKEFKMNVYKGCLIKAEYVNGMKRDFVTYLVTEVVSQNWVKAVVVVTCNEYLAEVGDCADICLDDCNISKEEGKIYVR
jgi:hypothetical protein